MKKLQKQKHKFFNIIIGLTLLSTLVFTGVGCSASSVNGGTAPVQTEQTQAPINALQPESVPQKNATTLKQIEKTGEKNGFLRFFVAMVCVLGSSLAIFFGLKLYKKFGNKMGKRKMGSANFDYENSLDSPTDFKEAINLFLHKSDK